ncbi:unnamed protein product [Prorocentrum cordatum]|uniref:Uncharacterized protein n=1 Tax=Prorocentrum cordatum TaxID=2364126 RepID=A0ABN9PLA6_9DINO|nr:unnamed protein product [Polarella glacialis]
MLDLVRPASNTTVTSSGLGEAESALARTTYSAGSSECEKGGQWQRASVLLSATSGARLEPNVNAGMSACGKCEHWLLAAALLLEMWDAKLEPDFLSYNVGVRAGAEGEQWQRALALPTDTWKAKLEPDGISIPVNPHTVMSLVPEPPRPWQRCAGPR